MTRTDFAEMILDALAKAGIDAEHIDAEWLLALSNRELFGHFALAWILESELSYGDYSATRHARFVVALRAIGPAIRARNAFLRNQMHMWDILEPIVIDPQAALDRAAAVRAAADPRLGIMQRMRAENNSKNVAEAA